MRFRCHLRAAESTKPLCTEVALNMQKQKIQPMYEYVSLCSCVCVCARVRPCVRAGVGAILHVRHRSTFTGLEGPWRLFCRAQLWELDDIVGPKARCPFSPLFVGEGSGSPGKINYRKELVPLFYPLYWRTWTTRLPGALPKLVELVVWASIPSISFPTKDLRTTP